MGITVTTNDDSHPSTRRSRIRRRPCTIIAKATASLLLHSLVITQGVVEGGWSIRAKGSSSTSSSSSWQFLGAFIGSLADSDVRKAGWSSQVRHMVPRSSFRALSESTPNTLALQLTPPHPSPLNHDSQDLPFVLLPQY